MLIETIPRFSEHFGHNTVAQLTILIGITRAQMIDQEPSPLLKSSGSKIWCDFLFKSDRAEGQGA